MNQDTLQLFYRITSIVFGFGTVISSVITLVQFISYFIPINFDKGKPPHQKRKLFCSLFFLFVLFVCAYFFKNTFIKVPSVINLRYEDACTKLIDCELFPTLKSGEALYVVSQSPEADTIVLKGTYIDLNVEPISTNEQVIESIEKANDLIKGTISFDLYHRFAYLSSLTSGETNCFGSPLNDIVIENASLEFTDNNGSQAKYDANYTLSGNKLVFSEVPVGVDYTLSLSVDNYYSETATVVAESTNPLDSNVISKSVYLVSKNDPIALPSYFFIYDSERRPLSCSKIQLSWDEGYTWRGDLLATDSSGRSNCDIYINENRTLWLKAIDPFKNGKDITFKIDLTYLQNEGGSIYPIAILYPDGRSFVTTTADFFSY